MNFNEILNLNWVITIIEEPIYLSIVILFLLAAIYSVLKKFFKLLIIILTGLIIYLFFLIITNQDLPGEYDEAIYNQIDSVKEKAAELIDDIKK